jgi:REP element-mobilizing transposase RayT
MANRYDPNRHHRRSIRLKGYDYTQPGAYFVTVCTQQREHLFDHPPFREVAKSAWLNIPKHRHARHVALDEWVLMPDHLHGILIMLLVAPGCRLAG